MDSDAEIKKLLMTHKKVTKAVLADIVRDKANKYRGWSTLKKDELIDLILENKKDFKTFLTKGIQNLKGSLPASKIQTKPIKSPPKKKEVKKVEAPKKQEAPKKEAPKPSNGKIKNLNDFTKKMDTAIKEYRSLDKEERKEQKPKFLKLFYKTIRELIDLDLPINYKNIYDKYESFFKNINSSHLMPILDQVGDQEKFSIVQKLRKINPDKKAWQQRYNIQQNFKNEDYASLRKIYKKALKDNIKLMPAAEDKPIELINKYTGKTNPYKKTLVDLYNKVTDFNIKFPPGTYYPPKWIVDRV